MKYNTKTPTKNICDYHKDIENLAEEISSAKSRNFEDVDDVLYWMNSRAEDILTAVEFAMVAGQNMEDRLRNYKETIESLGFRRVK